MPTMTLKDGRVFAYGEYGMPNGKPVFFIHGTPGSHLFHPHDEITKKLGIRLITTTRAGYGESTFQRGRRLLDFPSDIAQLADHLGIDKFSIVGHSGGGPHTLACAYDMPERILSAATLSGMGPVDAPGASEGLIGLNKFGITFGRVIPWFLAQALIWLFFHVRREDPEKFFDSEFGKRPPADDEIMKDPEVRKLCIDCERYAFQQGIKGYAWDTRILLLPWGFNLSRINVPVHLWHGTADNITSVPMAKAIANQIPGSKITILPSEGHMLLIPNWEKILRDLQNL
jgi:pimeloyl-ACP methyl ester carboxylesterase